MSKANVSAVLFVRDLRRLSEFYRLTLGLALKREDVDYHVLSTDGFDLVVHQIPARHMPMTGSEEQPRRREGAAIKLSFPVKQIAAPRAVARSLGGELDPVEAEWSDGESITCKGHDPEGNVFQVSAPI